MHRSGHTHLHEDVRHKLAGGLVQDLWQQRLALVALHVDLDDDSVGGDLTEDLGGGGGHGGWPNHLVPAVHSAVQRLLGDQVGGPRHVLVLVLRKTGLNRYKSNCSTETSR